MRPVGSGKRIALTLRPELDSVITRIADFQKVPKTTVINEMLTELLPVLTGISDAYSLIEQKQSPAVAMNAILAMSMQKIGELGNELAAHAQSKSEKCPDTLELPL
jgi:hypothetical protein